MEGGCGKHPQCYNETKKPSAYRVKFLKALPLCMLLLSSVSNKDVLFIFSANKVAAEEVPLWVPLEQKVVTQ